MPEVGKMWPVDPVTTGWGPPPHGYLRVLAQISPPLLLPGFEGFPELVRDPMGPRKEDVSIKSIKPDLAVLLICFLPFF